MTTKKDTRLRGFQPTNNKFHNPQIDELQQTISQQVTLNHKKYDQIVRLNPTFEYNLYKIHPHQTFHKEFGRQLLMRQLDRLLEEQNALDRQLSLIRFHDQETKIDKEELAATGITSYEILKNVWKGGSRAYSGAFEHAEELNNIVGHIRNNIKKITEMERCALEEGDQYYLRLQQSELALPTTCNKCKQTQEVQNNLKGQIVALQERISSLDSKNEEYKQQLSKKDQLIKQLSKKMTELQAQSKMKISLLQEKWLLQDHQVKQLKKIKNDIERNSIHNPIQGYRVCFNSQTAIAGISKETSLPLYRLLQMIVANPPSTADKQLEPSTYSPIINWEPNKECVPQLQLLPLPSSPQSASKVTRSVSRTERLISSIHQKRLSKVQEVGCSNKYVRSNHMTTKRNTRTVTCSQFEDAYATEDVKVIIMQNIETQN